MPWKSKKTQQPEQAEDATKAVIIDLARVTRVQRGGKRLRFRATVCVGDKNGSLGIGIAKGADVSIAVEKATRHAKKESIQIPITLSKSIPHTVTIKYKAAKIIIKPAPEGTGIKAGGVIRTLSDLAGIENITAKILGTNNKIVNAQAAMKAFQSFKV